MNHSPVPHIIPINDHRMALLDLNPDAIGKPIVLLHGITHSVGAWLTDTTFRQAGHCYAVSLPGHYPAAFPSDFREQQLTTELIAELTATTIKRTINQPVMLVGFSTGGFAALAVAALYPELVERVVILAGFVQGTWIGMAGKWQTDARSLWGRIMLHAQFEMIKRIPVSVFLRSAAWQASSGKPKIQPDNPLLQAFVPPLHAYFRHIHNRSIMHYFRRMPACDISDLARTIRQPTLVMCGSRDPIVPPAQGERIAALVPNAKKVVLQDCGHLLMLERPAEYAHALLEWLR